MIIYCPECMYRKLVPATWKLFFLQVCVEINLVYIDYGGNII